MQETIPQELNVVVMPNRSLELEWATADYPVSQSSRLIQEHIWKRFRSKTDSWLLTLGFSDPQIPLSPSLDYWRRFAGAFAGKLIQTPDLETERHKIAIPLPEDERQMYLDQVPMMTGSEYIDADLLETLWQSLHTTFGAAIRSFKGTVEAFIRSYSPNAQLVGRVFFHLVENKDEAYPFAFMATYSTRLDKQGASRHVPLKHALQEYGDDPEKLLQLLATVYKAAEKSSLMTGLLENGDIFHPLAWTSGDAFSFLKEIPIYEASGILCRIPNWWKGNRARVSLNFNVGDNAPSFVGMDALLSFNPRLFAGDMEISEAEARNLLDESEGLAFIKNKWVAVDRERLEQTLDAYEKAREMMEKEGIRLRDALQMQLMPQKFFDMGPERIDHSVSNGEWLESVVQKLVDPTLAPSVAPNKKFKATLREYQQKGINWLYFLHSLGFGACLADDMGLGKTVQVLGLLNILKSESAKSKGPKEASLLVIPASLIANWESEIRRFYPDLKVFIAHPGAGLKKGSDAKSKKSLNGVDLCITTYALVQRLGWLKDYAWNTIILDEAQAIKNPGTKQAKAIKNLASQNRIIMTGTPIENRLSDLWSLFDFLNPGVLGNAKEFKAFSKELKDNPTGYSRLRKIVSPYILRRLKTDKSVISDLPDKVEMKTYAPLSKKQVLLYKDLVQKIKASIAETDGIQRKGLILSSLMRFKQICNHPDQYLGTGGFGEDDSGKFSRLREICETLYQKREKVLIFTQFKEMTGPLHDFLETIFDRKGVVLHGSVPVKKRKDIISQFQSSAYVPFMVLSLKAGGVGLNLTEASHVIHFDRWWNPAVENQATDRAFRIGQKKNVIVHKFLTKGTVEEKIDAMLEEKMRLSQEVIAESGDAWITEMKDDALMDMFSLEL